MPYDLLDRVYGSKGYWHDMMEVDPSDRDLGLTHEELAAVLGPSFAPVTCESEHKSTHAVWVRCARWLVV